jgi:hypothetical protein
MGRKQPEPEPEVDPTAFLLTSSMAGFFLMHTKEIKYMCMVAYTFLHGDKVFSKMSESASPSYKFVRLVFQCTGGGTLVPIFINLVPVSLSTDAYPIAIAISYLLHTYTPILREVLNQSELLKAALIVMYETFRATVVIKLTSAAQTAIAPSDFSFAVFGPIICGGIAGCGGAFLPLDKGLTPIEKTGLAPNMTSALIGAAFYHLFTSTSLSDGVIDAAKKAHVIVAMYFIAYGLATAVSFKFGGCGTETKPEIAKKSAMKAKKES